MAILNMKGEDNKANGNRVLVSNHCEHGNLLEVKLGDTTVAYIDESGNARVEERDKVIEVLRGQ